MALDQAETTLQETECQPTGLVAALDLGQASDFSALVLNERAEGKILTMKRQPWQPEPVQVGSRPLIRHRVRFIHRWKLGTSYPDIVASVKRILAQLPPMKDRAELWIDGTGVGRAVVDIFREAKLDPVAVAITAGNEVRRISPREIRIPKSELASLVQAALQTGRIEIARDLAHSRTLEDELSNFRVKISAGGNETYEGRSGVNDDQVLALAIALFAAEKRNSGPGMAMLEIAAREMEAAHNRFKPDPVVRLPQAGSMEWTRWQAEEEARLSNPEPDPQLRIEP